MVQQLRICSSDETECYSFNATIDEWSDVEISQHPEGDEYRYEVKVNGVVIGSMLNKDAQVFEDVRVIALGLEDSDLDGNFRNWTLFSNAQGYY